MAATATAKLTLKTALTQADPNRVADALRKVDLGNMMSPIDETITIAAGVSVTPSQPIGVLLSARVVTGTATGERRLTDPSGTPSTSLMTLSADGKTLTLEANITVIRLVYFPRSKVALTDDFENA